VEEHTKTIDVFPQPQQQFTNTEELVQHKTEAVATIDIGTMSHSNSEEVNERSEDIPVATPIQLLIPLIAALLHLINLLACNLLMLLMK
jgi:hypothetical protein